MGTGSQLFHPLPRRTATKGATLSPWVSLHQGRVNARGSVWAFVRRGLPESGVARMASWKSSVDSSAPALAVPRWRWWGCESGCRLFTARSGKTAPVLLPLHRPDLWKRGVGYSLCTVCPTKAILAGCLLSGCAAAMLFGCSNSCSFPRISYFPAIILNLTESEWYTVLKKKRQK